MIKLRRSQSERSIDKELPRGRSQQILAADDFCDPHCGIIHHNRKLICGNIVVTPDDKIAKVLSCDQSVRSKLAVNEFNYLSIRHAKTPVHMSLLFWACGGIALPFDDFAPGRQVPG